MSPMLSTSNASHPLPF